MTEPLMKQLIDLKEEHELMLKALNQVLEYFNLAPTKKRYTEMISAVTVAKTTADMGNERRAAGNIELPDMRGMK